MWSERTTAGPAYARSLTSRLSSCTSCTLKSHFVAASEFKRPPDRRIPREALGDGQDATPRAAGLNGRSVPGSLVVQRQVVEPRHREALRSMRLEVLGLEDVIPWNSVRRTWKTKVCGWWLVGGWWSG